MLGKWQQKTIKEEVSERKRSESERHEENDNDNEETWLSKNPISADAAYYIFSSYCLCQFSN